MNDLSWCVGELYFYCFQTFSLFMFLQMNQVGGLVDGLVDTVKESPMFREQLGRSDDMLIIRGVNNHADNCKNLLFNIYI